MGLFPKLGWVDRNISRKHLSYCNAEKIDLHMIIRRLRLSPWLGQTSYWACVVGALKHIRERESQGMTDRTGEQSLSVSAVKQCIYSID